MDNDCMLTLQSLDTDWIVVKRLAIGPAGHSSTLLKAHSFLIIYIALKTPAAKMPALKKSGAVGCQECLRTELVYFGLA